MHRLSMISIALVSFSLTILSILPLAFELVEEQRSWIALIAIISSVGILIVSLYEVGKGYWVKAERLREGSKLGRVQALWWKIPWHFKIYWSFIVLTLTPIIIALSILDYGILQNIKGNSKQIPSETSESRDPNVREESRESSDVGEKNSQSEVPYEKR